ncbi:MAG: HAMP domain-containing histidine kinase [Acidobacteria bacterium]|nr:HAMP domain-containing histidine kinase [Acidobacteriota bacterium]
MSERRWFRSLYFRIAIGFVALLAALLLAQALLFLWLSGRLDDSPQGRTGQQLADFVARELSDTLTLRPDADLEAHVRAEFSAIKRPFAVLMHDGRRGTNRPDALPRSFPGPPRGPRGRRGGPGSGPDSAPIVVNGVQVGIVAVPPSPPAWIAVQRFGPTLALAGVGLLVTGVVAAALLIFGPTHRRLRALESATRALGEGRADVRASETGGDEVAGLARAFNRMADDLHARAEALAAADRGRRQLLADVSHELMTPLTAIRGYVQTLSMADVPIDDPTRQRYLVIADQETYKLEAIIGDLLDLARLEGGGESLHWSAVSVDALFQRVIDRHLPAIDAKHVSTELRVADGTPAVLGNPARLEQALQNLAANAIRHMPEGGSLALSARGEAHRVRITVRDTGPGIADQHLPHIFDRFYKADASRAGTTIPSGSGLGLSIVQAIVRQHGGEISAANASGGGAEFVMVLPAAETATS